MVYVFLFVHITLYESRFSSVAIEVYCN